ncbi:MAG: transglutaminaseTgpA domain-containing protein [Desulfomonile sp.]|nr:transglutaminaseTgpA domain-containing protein [Desulfomonile sp.]
MKLIRLQTNSGKTFTWMNRAWAGPAVLRRPVSVTYGRHRALKWFLVSLVAFSVVPTIIEENALHPLLLLILPLAAAALVRPDYSKPLFWSEAVFTGLFIAYVPAFLAYLWSLNEPLSPPVFLVYFTFGVMMVRCLSPLTDRNLGQLIVLSAGLVLINCINSNHLIFGLILPFYLFSLMGTLMLFHLARSAAAWDATDELPEVEAAIPTLRRRLAKSAGFIVGLAIILFIFLPRPFTVFPGLRAGVAGGARIDLSPVIGYGDMVSMMGRHRIAFKVKFEDKIPPAPVYWRGRVLEKTDGKVWKSDGFRWPAGRLIKPGKANEISYVIIPYGLQSKVVYTTGTPLRVLGRANRVIGINERGEVIIRSVHLVNNLYSVDAALAPIPVSRRPEPANLDQTGVTAKIKDLALEWSQNANSPRGKAQAIVSRLRRDFKYQLQVEPPPEEVHPIEHFLFSTRTGNCEHFATALALMLRAVGIPSRVVEGFNGMEPTSEEDEFIVRFARAHAWTEANLGDGVWTTLDATPPSALAMLSGRLVWLMDMYDSVQYQWIRGVVNFDRSNQIVISRALKQLLTGRTTLPIPIISNVRDLMLVIAVVAAVLVLIIYFVRQRRVMRTDAAAVYMATMRQLVRLGALGQVHSWHEENFSEIAETVPEAREALSRFMNAYLTARFGGGAAQSMNEFHAARAELIQAVSSARKQMKAAA